MQLRGLRLDGKFADTNQQAWAYAKNILISRGFDEIENEPGDTLFNDSITGDIIGRVTTPNEIILFSCNGTNTYFSYLNKNGVLTNFLVSPVAYLDFNPLNYPGIYIEGTYCYNANNELIVAFTTGYHKPMIVNVTTLLASPLTISTIDDLKSIYLFPEFTYNNFNLFNTTVSTSTGITTGGRLPAAAYFIALTYEIEPDVNTNFGIISNPIFIIDSDILTAYRQFKGNGTLVITNKAITINVSDLDTFYNYFKLAIIQRTETGTNCFITKRIKTSTTNVNVLIDDIDNLIPFDINEVVVASPAFDTIKTITQANKRLRLGYPSKVDKVSLDDMYNEVISKLDINWISEKTASLSTSVNSYKDSIFIFNSRGFRSDEVIALYLKLKTNTGEDYGIYHIPGRIAIGTELTDTTTIDSENISTFRVGSTATHDGDHYGKMGYWENENEVYPSGYGTITGSKVRHHRFPSAGQLHTWKGGVVHNTAKNVLLDALHLTADEFVYNTNFFHGIFTTSSPKYGTWVAASEPGYDYNKYTATTAQTLNIDLAIQCVVCSYGGTYKGRATVTVKKFSKVGINFVEETLYTASQEQVVYQVSPLETLTFTYNNDVALLNDEYITIQVDMESGTGSSVGIYDGSSCILSVYEGTMNQDIIGLRISFDWDSINSTIKALLESSVNGWEILYAKRTLNNQLMLDQSIVLEDGIGYRFYGFDSMANLLNIEPTHVKSELFVDTTDYISSSNICEVTNYSLGSPVISKIRKITYLPAYNTATVPSNENKENCYYFETLSGAFNRRLVNLINIKNNLYLDFTNQELVSTGIVNKLSDTSNIILYGGDTFVGHNSVITGNIATAAIIWYFPVESILNTGLRYEGDNLYEKFYPATNLLKWDISVSPNVQPFIDAMVEAGVANYYLYNNDYHLLNTLSQSIINNELTSITAKFPNRIHSSINQPNGTNSIYWKKFRPLDYVDIQNHKGPIYKMLGNDNIIYVQTDYSIFRGLIVDKLITADISVALKSAEMFDRPLEELHDADGNYIKPWDREGTILTPYGLVTVDLEKGSIYVISDKANEISKLGIEDWFRNKVRNVLTFENREEIGVGAILGYDDIYKRLLVTIKERNVITGGTIYGSLYNWYTISNPLFCPAGYHIPTRNELITLMNDSGGYLVGGNNLKEIGTTYWLSDTGATNIYGFNGRGSGVRETDGTFIDLKTRSLHWAITDDGNTYTFVLTSASSGIGVQGISNASEGKKFGCSVIWFKDNSINEGSVTDYDGNIYPTIKIGNQVITNQNIRVTHFTDGTPIPYITDNTEWANMTSEGMCYYDNDINNSYIPIVDPENDFTLSFQLEKMYWIAFHKFTPDKYINNSNGLYLIIDNVIRKALDGNKGLYNDSYDRSIIDFIFNDNSSERVLLKNIKWVTNVVKDDINYWDQTVTYLMVYSKNLCTGEITISKKEVGYNNGVMVESGNTYYRDGEWLFNDIKDLLITPNSRILDDDFELISASINSSKEYYDQSKFISKFFIVRMIYENESTNYKFCISNINIDVKKVLS